ncbi:amidohydrolase [Halorussus marinus]|uniref:amidohydrolase n=1 Tax=Halorussus marinus TaxID=2505976 RepID=UPI00109242E1|nr:amidohydrolase [Halorussus marinus]
MAHQSELLLRNGDVHLFDDDRTVAESVLFRGDRIAAVGSTDDVESAADDPDVVDLDGRTVLPGFNDAHTHILSVGIQLIETDLSEADDREQALAMLSENARDTADGNWVLGFGYDESTWPEGDRSYLSRAELDGVTETNPVAVTRVDGHTVSLNSEALEKVDFEGVEHDVITDEQGDPTGRVVEDAAGRVKIASRPDVEKARRALDAAITRSHELGITSVQTMAGLTAVRDHGNLVQETLQKAWEDDDLTLRVTYYVHASQAESLSDLELAPGFGDEYLRVGGLKTFSDGSLGSRTAKIHGEYADDPSTDGQMVHDGDELEAWFREAARADQQIATHAIGGRAIDIVLDRYEAVLDEYEIEEPRLRVEHVELATDEALDRFADHDIVASMQPNFLQWSKPDGLYEARLGTDALPTNNRFRDIDGADVPLAFGSDKMPPGPLYGIHHATNSEYDPQRLDVDRAIAAYTRGAAYAEHAEEFKGTLEPGKLADAVVLGRDPFEHRAEIEEIDVELTIVGGEVVYESS